MLLHIGVHWAQLVGFKIYRFTRIPNSLHFVGGVCSVHWPRCHRRTDFMHAINRNLGISVCFRCHNAPSQSRSRLLTHNTLTRMAGQSTTLGRRMWRWFCKNLCAGRMNKIFCNKIIGHVWVRSIAARPTYYPIPTHVSILLAHHRTILILCINFHFKSRYDFKRICSWTNKHTMGITNSLGLRDHMRAQLFASESNRFFPTNTQVLQNPTMTNSTYVPVIKLTIFIQHSMHPATIQRSGRIEWEFICIQFANKMH